jgi:hypothetical protein
MASYELKNRTPSNNEVHISSGFSIKDRDNVELARLGKKPVLKVCFSRLPQIKCRQRIWCGENAKMRQ